MKVSIKPLQLEKTIQIIFDFINRYNSDLFIFLKNRYPELYKVLIENQNKKNLKALIKLYKFIRDLPYKKDEEGIETITRQILTLHNIGKRDCDEKTVLMGSIAKILGFPYRVVIAGRHKKPHHIYLEIYYLNHWIPVDATYPDKNKFSKRLFKEGVRKVYYET
jgi:hypothetical protein